MMEFGAELADIYGDLYEIEFKKTKKSMENINNVAEKAIKNANVFTSIVYTKDDAEKFEYLNTMLNLELSVASKLTKWFTADGQERIAKTKEALDIYCKLDKFVQEYMKFKNITSKEEIENE
jgi:predicted component of type VI protein secretion system